MAAGYGYAAGGFADKISAGVDLPCRVHLSSFKEGLRSLHCGAGLFLEAERPSLENIEELITCKDQTLAVYGFSDSELREFSWLLAGRGIDRIVPVGQALNFQAVWDGYDMLAYFTREVSITV